MGSSTAVNDDRTKFAPIRRRRRRWAYALEARVEELAAKGRSPKQILAELAADPGFDAALPDLRTIQRRVAEIVRRDTSGAWSLLDGTPVEAVAVFAVLPAVIEETSGRMTGVSRSEAAALARLIAAVPDIPPWRLYLLARAYAGRKAAGTPTVDLDAFVAFGPWRSRERRDGYDRAVGLGWMPTAPGYLTGDGSEVPGGDAGEDWMRARDAQERVREAARMAVSPYIQDALELLKSQKEEE